METFIVQYGHIVPTGTVGGNTIVVDGVTYMLSAKVTARRPARCGWWCAMATIC